jgi:hypothetical protein
MMKLVGSERSVVTQKKYDGTLFDVIAALRHN